MEIDFNDPIYKEHPDLLQSDLEQLDSHSKALLHGGGSMQFRLGWTQMQLNEAIRLQDIKEIFRLSEALYSEIDSELLKKEQEENEAKRKEVIAAYKSWEIYNNNWVQTNKRRKIMSYKPPMAVYELMYQWILIMKRHIKAHNLGMPNKQSEAHQMLL